MFRSGSGQYESSMVSVLCSVDEVERVVEDSCVVIEVLENDDAGLEVDATAEDDVEDNTV